MRIGVVRVGPTLRALSETMKKNITAEDLFADFWLQRNVGKRISDLTAGLGEDDVLVFDGREFPNNDAGRRELEEFALADTNVSPSAQRKARRTASLVAAVTLVVLLVPVWFIGIPTSYASLWAGAVIVVSLVFFIRCATRGMHR